MVAHDSVELHRHIKVKLTNIDAKIYYTLTP